MEHVWVVFNDDMNIIAVCKSEEIARQKADQWNYDNGAYEFEEGDFLYDPDYHACVRCFDVLE